MNSVPKPPFLDWRLDAWKVALLVLLVKAMPLAARVVVVTLLVGGATFAAFRLVDAAKPPPSDDADEYDYSVFK